MSKKNRHSTTTFADIMGAVDDTVHDLQAKRIVPTQEEIEEENTEVVSQEDTVEVPEGHTTTTDNTGTTVAKPATPEKTVATAPVDPTKVSAEVNTINGLIEKYVNFNTGTIMRSEKDKQTAGSMFRDILFYAVDHPSKDVLDCVYRFFNTKKDKILAPQIVLPQTLHFNRDVTERIHCIYTLFRGLTGDKAFRLNIATTRSMLHTVDNKKVDALLMYFDMKSKR